MLMFLKYFYHTKSTSIQKRTFCDVKNCIEMFKFLELKAMHHNTIVIQKLY